MEQMPALPEDPRARVRFRFWGTLMMLFGLLDVLCALQTVSFVHLRSSVSDRHKQGKKKIQRSIAEGRLKALLLLRSNEEQSHLTKPRSKGIRFRHDKHHEKCFSRNEGIWQIIDLLDSKSTATEVQEIVAMEVRKMQEQNYSSSWRTWSVHEQVIFMKYLKRRRSYDSILSFLSILDISFSKEDTDCSKLRRRSEHDNLKDKNGLVKVYTTALFAIASSTGRDGNEGGMTADRNVVVKEILLQMERNDIPATTLTYIAVFKNLQGRPGDVIEMVRFLESRESNAGSDGKSSLNVETYNAAISACRAHIPHSRFMRRNQEDWKNTSSSPDKDWQTALALLQRMQRKGIDPTSETYHSVIDVLARNAGKVPMIRSIIQQWKNSKLADLSDNSIEDRIWATALNACAVVGDFGQAVNFMQQISETSIPNLRHCTALLKTMSGTKIRGQDKLAMEALDAMMGNETAVLMVQDGSVNYRLQLPKTDLDLVLLNTILSIVAKAGNAKDAQTLFDRIKCGEFTDRSGHIIYPDRITCHNLLAGLNDPDAAKRMVKYMRYSRRNRRGAIPPNSVTYAHAISVCQRAITPDLEAANQLLKWAKNDQIKHSVFMYASAIWTAQRCGDLSRCLELYDEMGKVGCSANSVVLNGVLTAFCDSGFHARAMEIFNLLKSRGFHVSPISLKRLIYLTTDTSKSQFTTEEILDILLSILTCLDLQELELKVSSPLFEALISIYGSEGDIDRVLAIVDQINGSLDVVCLRAILNAYSQCSNPRWWEAVEILHTTIVEESPAPGKVDQIALSHVLTTCSRANQFQEGLSLLNLYGIPVHDLPHGFPHLSVVSLNALIASCGRCYRPDLSLLLLNEISARYGLHPNSRSYRSAIVACNKAQHNIEHLQQNEGYSNDDEVMMEWWECSLALHRRMLEEGLEPDVQTHSSIISSCEAAGQWQRALGVLQTIIDNSAEGNDNLFPSLNVYCWNAAMSACEKGGAWIEAVDLYERMLESPFKPNIVTINALIQALDKANQKDLVQSIYDEALENKILDPWRTTVDDRGNEIIALDLHKFSEPMSKAAIRKAMDNWLDEKNTEGYFSSDLVIITGKGKHSLSLPVLQKSTQKVLLEYGIEANFDKFNQGRIIVRLSDLLDCHEAKSWRKYE